MRNIVIGIGVVILLGAVAVGFYDSARGASSFGWPIPMRAKFLGKFFCLRLRRYNIAQLQLKGSKMLSKMKHPPVPRSWPLLKREAGYDR
jgi:hypothetical protein